MEERSINRGEVWWVSIDDSIGGEQQTGRPVVVLSTDTLNQKHGVYVVAYVTSSGIAESCRVPIKLNGQTRRVICNQIRTLDKSRFTKYSATLTEEEMTRVARAVAGVMCIPLADKREMPIVPEVDVTELQMELALYKRMYRKTLDQLVDLRIEMDMAKRMAAAPEVIEEEPEEEVVVEDVEPEPPMIFRKDVELNSCTLDDLRGIGINEDTAIRLIEGRPYKKVEDVRTVDGVTSMLYSLLRQVAKVEPPVTAVVEVVETPARVKEYTWEEFKKLPESEQKEWVDYHRIELGETEKELADSLSVKIGNWYVYTSNHPALLRGDVKAKPKTETVVADGVVVNVNTATAKELMEKLGMAKDYAYAITRHRKLHGLFGDIEELLLVDRFSKNKYEEYKAHLTVTDVVAEEEPEQPEEPEKPEITPAPVVKCNVNTASPFELQQAGFTKKQSFHIVHSRKNKGPFYSIDELSDVDGIKKKDIRKLRDVLEV